MATNRPIKVSKVTKSRARRIPSVKRLEHVRVLYSMNCSAACASH